MAWPMIELKASIEDAIAWLEQALILAAEDDGRPDGGGWPALEETAVRIAVALDMTRRILPLPEEVEAAVQAEREAMSDYDSPPAF